MTAYEKKKLVAKLDRVDNESSCSMGQAAVLIAKTLATWVHLQVCKEKTDG